MIAKIIDVEFDNETCRDGYVTALIEDFILIYSATYNDPEEYGPLECEARFHLEEDETIPTDEIEREIFFEDMSLVWKPKYGRFE